MLERDPKTQRPLKIRFESYAEIKLKDGGEMGPTHHWLLVVHDSGFTEIREHRNEGFGTGGGGTNVPSSPSFEQPEKYADVPVGKKYYTRVQE